MRTWSYTYKTSDGIRHEAVIEAETMDGVYGALKEKGIRPIKVSERIAPIVRSGFKGLRKRDWFVFLGVLVVALGVAVAVLTVRERTEGLPVALSSEPEKNIAQDDEESDLNQSSQMLAMIDDIIEDVCRRAYEVYKSIDHQLILNYAFIAHARDTDIVHRELKVGHECIAEARLNGSRRFNEVYDTIPKEEKGIREYAEQMYGIMMGDLDVYEEGLDAESCVVELLEKNRGRWRVDHGDVVFDDESLSRQFRLYIRIVGLAEKNKKTPLHGD